jgi:hypothetical protein
MAEVENSIISFKLRKSGLFFFLNHLQRREGCILLRWKNGIGTKPEFRAAAEKVWKTKKTN